MSEQILPQLISGSVAHLGYPGIPEHWSAAAKLRARAVLNDLAAISMRPDEHDADPSADIEDFWENAARVSAAVQACYDASEPFMAHSAPRWSEDELDRRLGPVAKSEENRHGGDPLLMHPVTLAHGGREIELAGYWAEDEPRSEGAVHLVDLLAGMRDRGVPRAVVKLAGRKAGISAFELAGRTDEELDQALWADYEDGGFSMTMERVGGRPGAFMVQEWIPMESEYRFFVVDGKVVTGAACIEEHTPFDAPSRAVLRAREDGVPFLDHRVRRVRKNSVVDAGSRANSPQEGLVERPFLVAGQYAAFVESLGEELVASGTGTVVVDVAIDARTGEPVVVELNTLPNAGLYASDPVALYAALLDADDRGYGCYEFASGPEDPFAAIRTAIVPQPTAPLVEATFFMEDSEIEL